MYKKIFALILSVILLMFVGCDNTEITTKPTKLIAAPFNFEDREFVLLIPNDSDDITTDAIDKFSKKVQELSNNKLKITIKKSDNVFNDITQDKADMAIIRDNTLIQNEPNLNFLNMPFIFNNLGEYLSFVSGESNMFGMSEYLKNKYHIEIIGSYLNSFAYFLTRTSFMDSVGFYNQACVFVNETYPESYGALGLTEILVGTQEELYIAYLEKRAKYCEINSHSIVTDEVLNMTRSIGLTEHKYYSDILVYNTAREIEPIVMLFLKEAFSYTIEEQNRRRFDEQEQFLAELMSRKELQIYRKYDFPNTRQMAKVFYQKFYKEIKINQNIWDDLYNSYIKN